MCYEAAGAAGNALAAAIAARLGTESPATLKKLVRKYRLDAFATKHMETLPVGLARLEAAVVLRHAPDDGAAAAPRPKKDKRRAAVSSADAAAVGDSFALEDPGASGTLSKKKQAERDRKARDKEKEEKRRAKRKKAEARRREQAEQEAAAREEAAREEAAREAAERAAAAAAPAPAPAAADEPADEPADELVDDAPLEAAAAPPDDGDATDVRSRRERRAAADEPQAAPRAGRGRSGGSDDRGGRGGGAGLGRGPGGALGGRRPRGARGRVAPALARRLEAEDRAAAAAVPPPQAPAAAYGGAAPAVPPPKASGAEHGGGRRVARRFFVGALAKESTRDADLRAYFERFGAVSEAVVMGTRGFGFVTFAEESAARACAATRHHQLHGAFISREGGREIPRPLQARICKYAALPLPRRTGDCQYLHPEEEEYAATQARIEQYAPAPPAPAPPPAPPPRAADRAAAPRTAAGVGRPAAAAAAAADLAGRAAARAGAAGAARAARSARVGRADGARAPWAPPPSAWSAPSAPAPPADALWPATAVEDPPAWEGDGGRRAPRSDSDFVVPEGLVDVERRSNCSLDAIIAVLSQSPTFRRELGDGAEAAAAQSDALRYLGDAFRASAEGSDAGVDAAVDGLRAALAKRSNDEAGEGVRSELATGGAHLDVAEVLGEVVAVLGTAKRCRGAALALRTRGHIHQQAAGSAATATPTSATTWPSTSWRGRRRPPLWSTPRGPTAAASRTSSATRTRTRPSRATSVGRRGRAKSTWSSTTRQRPSC